MACFCVHSELPVFRSVFTCRCLSVCAVGAACPLYVGALWAGFVFCVHLTHSVPGNKPLIPRGCANVAHGMRPSFRVLCFCCLGKQPNGKQFQNELPSDEEREPYHFLLCCFDFQICENAMANQWNLSCLKHWMYTFHGWWQGA